MFSRCRIPEIVILDNEPQFSSMDWNLVNLQKWGFKHVASSSHYPQSTGKAENAVKTVQRLLTKCHKTGQSEYLALLGWHNTMIEEWALALHNTFWDVATKHY